MVNTLEGHFLLKAQSGSTKNFVGGCCGLSVNSLGSFLRDARQSCLFEVRMLCVWVGYREKNTET